MSERKRELLEHCPESKEKGLDILPCNAILNICTGMAVEVFP
jgi:hypothetical protein